MTNNNKAKSWTILGAIGSLAIFILGWFFAISPILDSTNQIEGRITSTKQDRQVQQLKLQKIQAIDDTEKAKMSANVAVLNASIPNTLSDDLFLSQMQGAITGSGVTVTKISINTKQSTNAGQAKKYPVTIIGSGSNSQAVSFISKIQTLNRLVVINSITWSSTVNLQTKDTTVKFTINGTIFTAGE